MASEPFVVLVEDPMGGGVTGVFTPPPGFDRKGAGIAIRATESELGDACTREALRERLEARGFRSVSYTTVTLSDPDSVPPKTK